MPLYEGVDGGKDELTAARRAERLADAARRWSSTSGI